MGNILVTNGRRYSFHCLKCKRKKEWEYQAGERDRDPFSSESVKRDPPPLSAPLTIGTSLQSKVTSRSVMCRSITNLGWEGAGKTCVLSWIWTQRNVQHRHTCIRPRRVCGKRNRGVNIPRLKRRIRERNSFNQHGNPARVLWNLRSHLQNLWQLWERFSSVNRAKEVGLTNLEIQGYWWLKRYKIALSLIFSLSPFSSVFC